MMNAKHDEMRRDDIAAFNNNWNNDADEETNAAIVSELNGWLN